MSFMPHVGLTRTDLCGIILPSMDHVSAYYNFHQLSAARHDVPTRVLEGLRGTVLANLFLSWSTKIRSLGLDHQRACT